MLLSAYISSLYVVFPARAPEGGGNNSTGCPLTETELLLGVECGDGRSAPQQAGYQLALLICTLCIAIIGGIVTGQWCCCALLQSSFLLWRLGLIARLPVFQAVGDDYLYDDSLYWNVR